MAEKFRVVDPYESYEIVPQENAKGVYGKDLLESVQSLQVGFGSKVLRIDRNGIWLGAESFASAPFSVDMEGNMVATSLDLSGYLQVGEALADIQSDIFDLSDIDTDLGVITAGTLIGLEIRGGLLRTSTSGARVEIDGTTDTLEIYDSGGNKRIMLDQDELIFYNASEVEMGSISAQSNYIGINTESGATLGVIFIINGTQKAAITSAGLNVNDDIIAATGSIDIGSLSQPFEDLFVDDLRLTAQTTNPSVDGMLRYYASGGTHGIRAQLNGSDFQFDASGV